MNGILDLAKYLLIVLAVDRTTAQSVRYSHFNGGVLCSGECVAITECEAALSKIRAGQNPKICGWTAEVPLVCCQTADEKTSTKHDGKISPKNCGKRIIVRAPVDHGGLFYPPAALENNPKAAIEPRRVHRDFTDRSKVKSIDDKNNFFMFAVGGTTSTTRWPWMVAIFNGQRHLCGGTLIDDRHVITAAHCFAGRSLDPSLYKVQVGELYLNEENASYDVVDIKPHEGYRRRYYYDDIAIVRLATSLPDLTPACLPADDSLQHGDNVTVLGWGDLSFGGPSTSKLQEVVNIPVVERSKCDAKFRTLPGAPFPRGMTDTFLCAGLDEGGKDACQGDSGGPLLHEYPTDHWTLVGVVSFGYKCGEPGYPGVYIRISSYIPWIEKYVVDQNEVHAENTARSRQFEYIDGKPIWKTLLEKVQFPR